MDNSNKKLLIIGAGIEQVYAYKLAKRCGYKVIGTDINPHAPAFEFADFKIIASTRDAQGTLQKVLSFQNYNNIKIDGVMTVANDVPLTVATIAKELNLKGISMEAATYSSNKKLMKEKLQSSNIDITPFYLAENQSSALSIIDEINYPVVIKPVDGRGSRHVYLLRSNDDILYLQKIFAEQDSEIIVEKYFPGPQYSTESMILDGSCYTVAISKRNYDRLDQFTPNIIEDGGTLPAELDTEIKRKINDLIFACAKALNYHEGSIKGDIVLYDQKPYIIEVALRLSGGFFCTHQIPATTGVDLVFQTMKLSLGEKVDPADLLPKQLCFMATRYFFPGKGKINSISGFEDLSKLNWIKAKELFCKEGDFLNDIKSHADRAGYLQAEGSSYREAESRAEKAIKSVRFKIGNS